MKTLIRNLRYKYFLGLSEGLIIEKKEEGIKKPLVIFIISFMLTYIISEYSNMCKKIDILSGILTFDGILIGFLMNKIILYLSLSETRFLKQLQEKDYIIDNKPIYVGEIKLSVYHYILYKMFFIISLEMFLAIIIIIKMILCLSYAEIFEYINIIIYFTILFILLYIIATFIRLINEFFSIIVSYSLTK